MPPDLLRKKSGKYWTHYKTKTHLCVWHAIGLRVDGMFLLIGKKQIGNDSWVNYGLVTVQL